MSITVIAERTMSKKLPDRYFFKATAKLYSLGEQAPYFSVTGELLNMRRRGDNRIESFGCLHELVLEHFPELKPVVDVHLAEENGEPMYAVENGAYWLGFTKYKTATIVGRSAEVALPYYPSFCSIWRVSPQEAREAYDFCLASDNPREALETLAVAMEGRWKDDAARALAVIRGDHAAT